MKRILMPSLLLALLLACSPTEEEIIYEVLVLGEGTGATAAALQAARSGARTAWANPLPWAGGMLTSAGVSAVDGNHHLPAGLWGEFRAELYAHYGGPKALATGWVSHAQFEPSVGAAIFDRLLSSEAKLTMYSNTPWHNLRREGELWAVDIGQGESWQTLKGKVLIDGTDLGDVAAAAGAGFDLGMDSRYETGEAMAPEQANDIIQDLTYVAILKDYGQGGAPLLPEPPDYDPADYYCLCAKRCDEPDAIDCDQLLNYGKLPNGKYMINWPIKGNDYYVNPVGLSESERAQSYDLAKEETLRFVYYLQHELGYGNLGLADDEFPTADRLALMPYHREGRRIHGLARFTVNHIQSPYQASPLLYQTGIAVGDYPIDHHHGKHEGAPKIDFPPVPSFSIPAGCLIAKGVPNLLIADKAISVSNIANGSTRLQPVILQVGQVAGLMAALSTAKGISPAALPLRELQQAVLDAGGYLMPYYDVAAEDAHFQAIQRAGATGLLAGQGEPYQWANRTWFYPDSVLLGSAVQQGFQRAGLKTEGGIDPGPVNIQQAAKALLAAATELEIKAEWTASEADLLAYLAQQQAALALGPLPSGQALSRRQWAVLADHCLRPFEHFLIGFEGIE